MPALWHPPRHSPDPDLISFEIPEDGLAYDYSGETLDGRYHLDKPIGPGGTSTVYRAKDLRTGAQVAVKILNASMHEHLLGLFGQEGRVAARHTCPHLVQAIDLGKHEDCAFTVFKFADGISLYNLGRDNPLPWRRVVRIAIQILAALDDLHRRGLVHCDLHPSNVLVQRDLEGLDFATVIDLGFAFVIPPKRITGAPEPTEYVFGLRRYIAPERRAGDAPGPRSDLYSLGVLLWELLTAQILPAYELDPGLAIPPVRTIAPGLDIPEALDAIVMRALSDVEYRFRDAQEMAQALRDVLDPPALAVPAVPTLPAAAVAVTTLPAPTLAAAPPPPSATAAGLASPVPSAFLTRKGLSIAFSLAFASGAALGAVSMQAATAGEVDAAIVKRLIVAEDDITKQAGAPFPFNHIPLSPPTSQETAQPPTGDVTPTVTPRSAVARHPILSPQASRARKWILTCNPPKAQLTAMVVIERKADGRLEVRFNGYEPLGVFGDCALKVAQALDIRVGHTLTFALRN